MTVVTEALVSVFGKEMRPGSTSVYALPWDEISAVSLSRTDLGSDGDRGVDLTVNLTYGEFVEVHEDAEGFADAVRQLCRLSGIPDPDPAALPRDEEPIWPGPRD